MPQYKLSVLIPVFNEIKSINDLLNIVKGSLPGVTKEIIVVDDGSTDGTGDWLTQNFDAMTESEIAWSGGKQPDAHRFGPDSAIKVILHESNRGKGGAIQTAMRASTGSIIIIQDADLEYDPGDWGPMYDLIARRKIADVVYGSRFYGRPHRSLYYHHYLANRLISTVFNIMFNQTLTDIEVCYKMFTREVLETLKLTATDFGIEIQISAQICVHRRWRIYETGIRYYGRTYEEGKKINWKDGVKALGYLVKFRWNPGN